MNVQKYIIDAVIETNEGRKDFQELVARFYANGKHKAVEMRDEIDYYFARKQGRDDISVFFYKEENAPDLAIGKVMQVK